MKKMYFFPQSPSGFGPNKFYNLIIIVMLYGPKLLQAQMPVETKKIKVWK